VTDFPTKSDGKGMNSVSESKRVIIQLFGRESDPHHFTSERRHNAEKLMRRCEDVMMY
jgi:hypothetical protein